MAKSSVKDYWKRLKIWILFGVGVLAFAFMGLIPGQYQSFTTGGAAAIVNDEVISMGEYQRRLEQMRGQLGDQFQNLPPAQRQMFTSGLQSRALESLISTEILTQAAENEGFFPAKEELQDQIVDIPAFQENGRFSHERYRALLQSNRLSVSEFEKSVRDQAAVEKVRELFEMGMVPSPDEIELERRAEQTKIHLEFVELSREELKDQMNILESQLNDYINQEENQQEIQNFYEQNKSDYQIPEQVKARHILIKADPENEDSQKKAQERIQEISEIATVDNFAELAEKHSEDQGSADRGGDLGFFERGRMAPEFEEIAFSLAPKTISEPVETSFGYHLILVEEHQEASVKPLEQVKKDVTQKALLEQKVDEIYKKIKEFLQNGQTQKLVSLLKQYKNLEWEDTGEFALSSRFIPKIGRNETLLFDALEVNEGELVDHLVQSRGKSYIVRMKKRNIPELEPLNQADKEEQIVRLTQQKSSQLMNAWVEHLQEQATIERNAALVSQQLSPIHGGAQ